MHRNHVGRVEFALFGSLIVLVLISLAGLAAQIADPRPWLGAGLALDRLSATIALLVAGVGAVVYRFSLHYLEGEPNHHRFLRWLAFTVFAAYLFILADHLALLFAAWLLTSIGLHHLLTFYAQRRQAHPPARKKFLISRLGDLALLGAIGLIFWQWGTLDLHRFLAALDQPASWPAAPTAAALLLVIAALTKSAQFPFHSWLPETMESPTPVSALMHAGIINGGGVLLLKFAPLLVAVPAALFNLVLVGALTAVLGLLAMWAQTNVKRTLAWSTVSQMGFMMVQIGLAAFPAALLHLVGHGCYKAWSFLRASELPPRGPASRKLSPSVQIGLILLGTLLALPALGVAAQISGFDPFHSPGELALTGVVAVALGQIWPAIAVGKGHPARHMLLALLITQIGAVLILALYQAAIGFYAPLFGALPVADQPLNWLAAGLAFIVVLLLSLLYPLLPLITRHPHGRALSIHALHGFYVGAVADQLVAKYWPYRPTIQEVDRASS